MNRFAGFVPNPSGPTKEPMEPTPSGAPLQEDVEMSSGSSGNETNENCSTGRGSQSSDCDDSGKELGLEPPDARQRWAQCSAARGAPRCLLPQGLISLVIALLLLPLTLLRFFKILLRITKID